MMIRNLINRYLEGNPLVCDTEYRLVPAERLRSEYAAIRRNVLLHHAPGDWVGLGLSRNYRYFLALLACMESGIAFVPLRLEWPTARVEQIRGIVGFRTLLTDERIAEIIAADCARAAPEPVARPVAADQPLYCMFTSGTTGVPKGVVIRRSSYENFLRWCDEFFADVGPHDRLLNSTDYTFDVALAEVALALTRRAAFLCSRFRDDLFTLLHELHQLKVSVIATVPNNFMMLLDERWMERVDLSALRHALIAGARFPVALDRQFKKFLPQTRVYNCYGPTEATIYCLARQLGNDQSDYVAEQTVSVGSPIPGCLPRIVDEKLQPVAAFERGELLMGGVQVMDGYINDSLATDRALAHIEGIRYYRTGDIAFRDEKGGFFVTGRNDDTIKVSGQRVNLSDIDGYVQKLEFVRSCATISIEDALRGASLVLFVVAARPVSKEAAFAALREILPKHQLPQEIRFMENLPVNNSGKVSKRSLLELYLEGRVARGD